MLEKTTRILLIIGVIFFTNLSIGQDLYADLKKMQEKMLQMDELSMKMDVLVKGKKSSIYDESIEFHKKAGIIYYGLNEIELLMDKEYIIMVNHNDRSIVVTPNERKGKMEDMLPEQFTQLKNSLSMSDTIRLIASDAKLGTKTYDILYGSGLIDRIEISFEKSGLMKSVEYSYRDKSNEMGELAMIKIKNSLTLTKSIEAFTVAHYFKLTDSGFIASENYKGYSLIFNEKVSLD